MLYTSMEKSASPLIVKFLGAAAGASEGLNGAREEGPDVTTFTPFASLSFPPHLRLRPKDASSLRWNHF
jgi:hypothetical protein